jgi:hypothetical protein
MNPILQETLKMSTTNPARNFEVLSKQTGQYIIIKNAYETFREGFWSVPESKKAAYWRGGFDYDNLRCDLIACHGIPKAGAREDPGSDYALLRKKKHQCS